MPPASKTWVNGLAQTYSEEYDEPRLRNFIDRRTYLDIMERINDTLINYFPCPLCMCFGYLFAIFTCGLSFLCPYICISDAENNVRDFIERLNRKKLKDRRVHLTLRKKCGTSWLEFRLPAEGTIALNASDANRVESAENLC